MILQKISVNLRLNISVMNKIGIKIRQLREIKGYSQEYMALELGITQSTYARLEQDDSRINITRLQCIADVLDTSVTQIMNDKISQMERIESCMNFVMQLNKEYIETLKEEIFYLKELLSTKK